MKPTTVGGINKLPVVSDVAAPKNDVANVATSVVAASVITPEQIKREWMKVVGTGNKLPLGIPLPPPPPPI